MRGWNSSPGRVPVTPWEQVNETAYVHNMVGFHVVHPGCHRGLHYRRPFTTTVLTYCTSLFNAVPYLVLGERSHWDCPPATTPMRCENRPNHPITELLHRVAFSRRAPKRKDDPKDALCCWSVQGLRWMPVMVVRPPPIRLMVRVLAFDKGGWRNSTARLRLKYASPGGRVRCVFLTFSAPRTSSFFRPKKCAGDCRPDQTERARSPGNDRGLSNSTRQRSWPMRCSQSPKQADGGLLHNPC